MIVKSINNFIDKVANFLGDIPSRIYAFVYVLLIFVFAILYTLLPNNFYHSTVQYENSLNNDAEDILKAIKKRILDHQKSIDSNSNIIINDKVFIDGNELLVHSLKYEDNQNNEVSFKIRLVIYDSNDKYGLSQISESQKFTFSLDNKMGLFDKSKNEMIYYFTLIPEDTKNLKTLDEMLDYKKQDIYKTLFPEKYINGSSPPDRLIMTLPQKLLNKIIGLKNANKGFPSNVSNNFIRMFYLSAVTITTVGYGDVLPITTFARILISIEAILGILISGLFLSSLANRINRRA